MPGFRLAANDNFPKMKEEVPDIELNMAVVQSFLNAVEEMRASGENPDRFSESAIQEAIKETSEFNPRQAIQILNGSVRAQWEKAPAFYRALLKKVQELEQPSESY